MKRSRQRGFTLVELMVVICVTALVAGILSSLYRKGLLIDSEQSRLERILTSALHTARMRALNNQNVVAITGGQSINFNVAINMFEHVQFTAANHGFATGDTVTFSGLNQHAGMNGGSFYVTVLDSNTFKCLYYTQVAAANIDTAGSARSLNKSSLLTIKNKPNPALSNPADIAQYQKELGNPAFFYYEGKSLSIWDATGITVGSAAFATAEAAAQAIEPGPPSPTQWPNTVTATVAFNSRGYATNTTGYLLVVDRNPAQPNSQKYVRISPSGKIKPGY